LSTRTLAAALSLALCLAIIPAPASAHTWRELNDWLDAWHARLTTALGYATGRLPATPEQRSYLSAVLAEHEDMLNQHPGWDGDYLSAPKPQVHTAAAKPKPKPHSYSGGVEQWRPLVETYFAPHLVATAMCIMDAESRGDPTAKNPRSTAAGLFQFLKSTWDKVVPSSITGGSYSSGQVYDPEANVRAAAWLQAAAGWTQWSPYKHGACRGL